MNLPLRYFPNMGALVGATWKDVEGFYPFDPIRQIERASIRVFMEAHRERLRGRVLDFGAGLQPYRDLVQGEYVPLEKDDHLTLGPFDAVMFNQVSQYVWCPGVLDEMYCNLRAGGHLVMTYATNWDEVEETDLWRFTKAGMTVLLERAGFKITAHERRAEVAIANFKFPLGYGVVCTRS